MKLSDLNKFKNKWVYVEFCDDDEETYETWGILSEVATGSITTQEFDGKFQKEVMTAKPSSNEPTALRSIPIDSITYIQVIKVEE